MTKIFLSYARRNIDVARRVHRRLAEFGFDVWVDWEQVGEGDCWQECARAGIDSASVLTLIICRDFLMSRNCQMELLHAIQRGKAIVALTPSRPTPNKSRSREQSLLALKKMFASLDLHPRDQTVGSGSIVDVFKFA
jgi:hypothetical protein